MTVEIMEYAFMIGFCALFLGVGLMALAMACMALVNAYRDIFKE